MLTYQKEVHHFLMNVIWKEGAKMHFILLVTPFSEN
jgi:hypothetical protein